MKPTRILSSITIFAVTLILSMPSAFARDFSVVQRSLQGGERTVIVTPDRRGNFVHYELTCRGEQSLRVITRLFECSGGRNLHQTVVLSDGSTQSVLMGGYTSSQCSDLAEKFTREAMGLER